MRFEGTSAYVATDDLKVAVNAAITLERPLLVKGEPGTGKTVLALEVAKSLGAPLLEWHVKSTTKAIQGLYEYDAVSRLRDSQLGDARVKDIRNYIKRGKLWDAFVADDRPVLLIDEIDKADIEFPNDLLPELDRMEFFVYETGETVKARRRPIVVITSNNEKELPDAFLRRCFFHYIRFPDADTMRAIIEVHFPGIKQRLVSEALKLFYEIRDVPGMKKKPSTSELLDWLKLLLVEDIGPETFRPRRHRRGPRFDIHLVVAVAPRRAPGHALIFVLALTRRARLEALEPVEPPIKDLHRRAAEAAAGPDELERREQSPRVVALDDGLGQNIARHGGGVESVTAEGAREPEAPRKLADLRPAMQRIAAHARPGVLDFDLPQLGVDRHHVGLEPPPVPLGIGL